jgi:(R,R)-butanediol dehydrogenase/meso-butanediol dehydrogenase/diacetyl reductase
MPILCKQSAYTGIHSDGSMAEYLVVPWYTLHKVPDSISDEIAVLAEPLAVGLHAVRRSGLKVGDTVTVIGAGTIGLCTVLACKAAGASRIFVIEILKARMDRALTMGANEVTNPIDEDSVERIRDLTDGLGTHVSFDCVGLASSGPMAVEVARDAGTAVIVGMSPEPSPSFNFINIMAREKTVLGAVGSVGDVATVIELIADGRLNPNGFITAKVPLENAVEKGFMELIRHPEENIKILVKP